MDKSSNIQQDNIQEYSVRVQQIISHLEMKPHPEGGNFKANYKSSLEITAKDSHAERIAMTHIYYLLSRGEKSIWHKVKSEEVWNFYEGDSLELKWINPEDKKEQIVILGILDKITVPSFVIPRNCWQAAKPLGEYALVGCTVAPGFEWEDFEILSKDFESPLDLPEFKQDTQQN